MVYAPSKERGKEGWRELLFQGKDVNERKFPNRSA